MVPRIITSQLSRLRWRERILRLAWSATLWLSVAALALTSACTIDWIIDRNQDTPWALRYGMFVAQAGLWIGTAIAFLAWALFRRMRDVDLALRVEEQLPQFGDRLISALQLNQPGANTRGMSPDLIAAVTRQAEEQAGKVSFASLADHRHWHRTVRLAIPLLLAVLLAVTLWSDTLAALVQRQLLRNVDIPRSVTLSNATREVWPSGEEVVLRFQAAGTGVRADSVGTVRIIPQRLVDVNTATFEQLASMSGLSKGEAQRIVAQRNKEPFKTLDELRRAGIEPRNIDSLRQSLTAGPQPTEDYPLTADPKAKGVFLAKIPPGTSNFTFKAWLEDGRLRQPGQVRYEPRPAITQQRARLILPEYCGLRPSGQRYEIEQPKADIRGLPGSSARIMIETQKPVKQATLEMLGADQAHNPVDFPGIGADPILGGLGALLAQPFLWKDAPEAAQPKVREIVTRRVPMTLSKSAQAAETTIELRPAESAYRIVVEDEHEFVNLDPPRRKVEIVPEGPPRVELLAERFPGLGDLTISEEDEVAGIPILQGSKVRIGYSADHEYGLGKATLVYRINEGEWWRLPLAEVAGDPAKGPFVPRRGQFLKSLPDDRVEFHAVPSPDPEVMLGRTIGGGQLDFETAKLPGIKTGDRLEYFVEVASRNPGMADNPGRSDIRLKTIVPESEFFAWMRATLQQEARLRQLEKQQRGVFSTPVAAVDAPTTPVKPITLPEKSNFVREWHVIGPFPDRNGDGHGRSWPPQTERIDLGREYDNGQGNKLRWKLYRSPQDLIDLQRCFNDDDPAVGYAVCWAHAEERKSALLSFGVSTGAKVYVNRAKVLDRTGLKTAEPGQAVAAVNLLEGWNEILVKVHGQGGPWGFYFELVDPQLKKPVAGVSFRPTPPEDDNNKFVRHWMLLGPLANPDNGRDIDYPPEKEPIEESAEYDGIDGKIRWRKFRSGTNKIDLARFFERPFSERNLAYAVCWVKARQARPAVLATGSDDGIKVWLNRDLKINKDGQREAIPGTDSEKVELREGWNEILVKVDNRFGRWAFYLELRDSETGRPLDGLELRIDPPPKE